MSFHVNPGGATVDNEQHSGENTIDDVEDGTTSDGISRTMVWLFVLRTGVLHTHDHLSAVDIDAIYSAVVRPLITCCGVACLQLHADVTVVFLSKVNANDDDTLARSCSVHSIDEDSESSRSVSHEHRTHWKPLVSVLISAMSTLCSVWMSLKFCSQRIFSSSSFLSASEYIPRKCFTSQRAKRYKRAINCK